MSSQQLKTAKELVEKLLVTSKRFSIPSELLSIIDLLAKTLAPETSVAGGAPAAAAAVTNKPYPPMTDFDNLLLQFQAASEELKNPEITGITEQALQIFEMMKLILAFSFTAKKPLQSQVQGIAQILQNKSAQLVKSAPNHPIHAKSVQEGLGAVFWVFSELPKQQFEAAIEPCEYSALKLQQQKIPTLSKWINSYIQALKALQTYTKTNYPTGLSWNFKGDGDYPTLYSQLRGEIVSTLRLADADIAEAAAQAEEQIHVAPTPVPAPVVQQHQAPATATKSSYPPMTDFDNAVNQLQAAATKLDPELQELTELVVKAFNWMKIVMQFSKELSKPNADQLKQIQKILQDQVYKPINASKAGVKFPNHLKTVIQGLAAITWVFSDVPKSSVENGIESSEFYGNKVLLMKIPEHSAWNNAFKAILKSLMPYVLINFSTGLQWKIKGQEDYSEFYAVLSGQKTSAAVAPPAVVAAPVGLPPPPPIGLALPILTLEDFGVRSIPSDGKPNTSDLMKAINVGGSITSGLRHVTKGEKYDNSNKEQAKAPQLKDKLVAQQVPANTVVKKEPKKYKKDNMFLENFEKERIEIEAGELLQKESLFIDNCNNCTIVVKGKVKSVFINKCKKSTILVYNAVSGIELVDCTSNEIYVMEQVPSIQVDKSHTVRITFMKERTCDIVSSKTSGLNVTYALNEEGDIEKDTPIPEQFVTKWDPATEKFKTYIMDTFLC